MAWLRLTACALGLTLACSVPERIYFDDTDGSGGSSAGGSSSGGSSSGGSSAGGSSSGGSSSGGTSGGTTTGGNGGSSSGGTTSGGSGGSVSGGNGGTSGGGSAGTGSVLPSVEITSASVGEGATTHASNVSFTFSDNPAGSAAGFQCDLDDSGSFEDCSTGFAAELLDEGAHSLDVRGVNAEGTPGPILTREWTVEALDTTIQQIQTGNVGVDTLVRISTNVRVTAFTSVDNQTVFVQEANYVSDPTAVAHRGIMTKPRTLEASMAVGLAVAVKGTVKELSGNTAIVRATYTRGSLMTAYEGYYSNQLSDLAQEEYEGVWLRMGGGLLGSGCPGACPAGANFCLEDCYAGCNVIGVRNVGGVTTYPYGEYFGTLVGTAPNAFELWVFESEEHGDDICM